MSTACVPSTSGEDSRAVDGDNPWPGLLPFREADSAYFQGRRAETEDLLRLVMRERLTVFFGVSGLGKSSLLQAGLFPLLRQEHVFPVYIRLDFSQPMPDLRAQICQTMARAAVAAEIEIPSMTEEDTLWEQFHRHDADFWNQRNRLVLPLLVFDQFEELFTLGRSDPARASATDNFLVELSDLAEGRPPAAVKARLDTHPEEARQFAFGRHHYKILLSIREDFLPELETLRVRCSAVALNRLRLHRLHGEAALLVVNQAPHLIDSPVAEQVVRFVAAGRPGVPLTALQVEPALLSVVCRELNNKRRQRGEAKITAHLLEGSQDEVIASFYATSVADLAPEVRSFIEERLLTVSGYRDSVALENAFRAPGMSREAIDRLVARRLVRIEDYGGVQRLELTHDLLTGAIRASRDRRRQVEVAEEERLVLLEAQQREREALHRLRRSRRLMAAFLVVALVAVGTAMWAIRAQRQANRQAGVAASALERFAVKDAGDLVKAGRPDQALAYLARAVRANPHSTVARRWIADLLRRSWWVSDAPIRPYGLGEVGSAGYSADGRLIVVTTSFDGSARVLQANTGTEVGTIQSAQRRLGFLNLARFSVDGGRVTALPTPVSISGIRTEKSTDGRSLLIKLPEQWRGPVKTAKFSPVGSRLVTAWANGFALIWDVEKGQLVAEPLHHGDSLAFASFSPDGNQVVTASADGTARIWTADSGQPIGAPLHHAARVNAAAFSPDSRHIVTASSDGMARVWDANSGQPIGDPLHHNAAVNAAVFSPDGRRVLTASSDGMARVWDANSGQPIGDPLHHNAAVNAAVYSPDGRRVLTASSDGMARVWDANSGQPIGEPLHHEDNVNAAVYSPDGRRVLTASDDGTARVWRNGSVRTRESLHHDNQVNSARFSPDGRRIVTASHDNTAQVWDVKTRQPFGVPLRHDSAVLSAVFSPDSRRVLTVTNEGTAHIWPMETGQSVGVSLRQAGRVVSAAFSPDSRRLVTATNEGIARVWQTDTGEPVGAPLRSSAPDSSTIKFVAFTPDGRRVITGSSSKDGGRSYTELWDANSGNLVGAPVQEVWNRAEKDSHNGRHTILLVDNNDDKKQRQVWAVLGTDGVGRITPVGKPLQHKERIQSATFSPDDIFVVTASDDHTAQIWETNTGRRVGGPLQHRDRVVDAAFSPDGRLLVTACADGTAQVWEVAIGGAAPEEALQLADLAEVVGGYAINEFDTLFHGIQREQLEKLQRRASQSPEDGGTVASFVRAFFSGTAN